MTDQEFIKLLPEYLQPKAITHFSPVEVIMKAGNFLCAKANDHILDIGSGVGKFCLLAGMQFPENQFTGVELREDLVLIADEIKEKKKVPNVFFKEENIKKIQFKNFNHFYFFNPFHENVELENKLDDQIFLNEKLYLQYSGYVYRQWEKMPIGTRIAAFFAPEGSIPPQYEEVNSWFDDTLIGYEKVCS